MAGPVRQGMRYRQGDTGDYPDFSVDLHPAAVEQGYYVVQGKGKKVFFVQVKFDGRNVEGKGKKDRLVTGFIIQVVFAILQFDHRLSR